MAKMIKITQECIDQARKEFDEMLSNIRLTDGKISYTKNFVSEKRPCTVFYTEKAWLKMQSLIRECDKEVGWHGIAYRGEDPAKDEYYITDIMVYPQEVTGVTVTTDQTKYQTWLMNHDDEVFNNIRMQGHSHVNMGVTPSATDETLYESFLSQLDDTMFYIFLIYNKRGDCTYKIYDLAKNIMFDTSDVSVCVEDNEIGIEKFLREAKEMVKERVYTPVNTPQSKYYPSYYGSQPTQSTPPAAPQKPKEEIKPAKPANTPALVAESKKCKKAKGGKHSAISAFGAAKAFGFPRKHDIDDSWDEMDDPYGPFGYSDRFYCN